MIQIDSDIPMPFFQGKSGRPETYPWGKLEVGQSFFVPNGNDRWFRSSCGAAGKRYGWQFRVRAWTENGVEGVRVWRVD